MEKIALSKDPDINSLMRELSDIIYTLQQVPAGTTVSTEAQNLLSSAQHTWDKLSMN